MPENPQIVLAIPGFWTDRSDLVQRIALESEGYLFAGVILLNSNTHDHWELNVLEADQKIMRTLSLTGQGSITSVQFNAITEHTMVCELSGEAGSLVSATQIANAGAALIRAGGAAVYVESAGKSHSDIDWLRLCDSKKPSAMYEAFVIVINDDASLYSCGMHNLGLPDARVLTTSPSEETAKLLRAFNLYRLLQSPDLETGHTFSLTPESTYYRIALLPCDNYEQDDLFFNPFGVWQLTPIE